MFIKNKKLLLLGTFALVFTSGLAAAGTTFAWYQTNRNASLTFSSAEIENYDSNLNMEFIGSNSGVVKDGASSGNDFVFNAVNRVTDISGDGIDFYKPYWTSREDEAAEIIKVDGAGFYIDFLFKLSRDHEDDPDQPRGGDAYGLKVFLGAGSAILPLNGSESRDVEAVKAARMAVIHYEDAARTNPEVQFVYAAEEEPDAKYLKKTNDPIDKAYNQAGYLLENAELDHAPFVTKDFQDEATYEIADLMTETEAYVGFRFWIEGTDAEAVRDKSLGGMFRVDLKIYALHDRAANLPQR